MELLKERIRKEGSVLSEEILKVDSFLNHQIDPTLMNEMGKAFKARFGDEKITKIVTIESSGIAVAVIAAQYFKVPVVFAKKSESRNLDAEVYSSEVYSFTRQKHYRIYISRRYINADDHILVIDDFLANGQAALGLMHLLEQAGASLAGIGIVIEKGFQKGGLLLRNAGVRVESLAIVKSLQHGKIIFEE